MPSASHSKCMFHSKLTSCSSDRTKTFTVSTIGQSFHTLSLLSTAKQCLIQVLLELGS